MCVVWPQSTGTAEVRTRRWKQQENATLVPSTPPNTHPCCTSTDTEREITHAPTCTKTDHYLLFLSHMSTMTHSQLSSHSSHTQMHSWAHVCTGWTDADRWERWGCAPGTFAHPTHQYTFHTEGRVEELYTYACYIFFCLFIFCKWHSVESLSSFSLVEILAASLFLQLLYLLPACSSHI